MKLKHTARLVSLFLILSVIGTMLFPLAISAEETIEIFDDLKQGETLFVPELSIADNLGYTTSKQTNITDLSRIYKKSHDGDLDKNTYLTYYSDAPMLSFEVAAGYRKCQNNDSIPGDFKFEVSSDGMSFTSFGGAELELNTSNWGKNLWKEGVVRSVASLPESTHYLRIYLPGTAHMEARDNTALQMESVKITCRELGQLSDLSALAQKVTDVLNGAEVGDKTGQYTQGAVDALQLVLSAVEKILQDSSNYTAEQRQAAYNELSEALEVFLASANPPVGSEDSCDNLNLVYRADDNIESVGDNPVDFGGDSGRFVRSSGLTGGELVYRAEEMSTYTDVTVKVWSRMSAGNVPGDITIEALGMGNDPDMNSAYKLLTAEKELNETNWTDGEWRMAIYKAEVPSGTEYLRITFGDCSNVGDPSCQQIGSVEWNANDSGVYNTLSDLIASAQNAINDALSRPGTYPTERIQALQESMQLSQNALENNASAEELKTHYIALTEALHEFKASATVSGRIVDECADFTKTYARSSNDVGVAESSPEKFEGDDKRFSRSNKKTGEYVIYAANEGKRLTYFQANVWYNKYSNKIPEDMILEAAPIDSDPMLDESYTVLNASKSVKNGDNWPNDGWRLQTYTVASLPANTQYVRVTFGDSSNTDKSWTIQIGSLEWEETAIDYRSTLLPLINKAAGLMTEHPVGNEVGMSPQEQYDLLKNVKTNAETLYASITATGAELRDMCGLLENAISTFEDAIIRALNWPDGAVLTTSSLAETSLTLYWPKVLEHDNGGVTYSVYSGEQLLTTTSNNTYEIKNLFQGKNYSYTVVAVKNGEESKPLGPVTFQTLRYGELPPPDFSKIRPDDFTDEDYLAPLVWGNDTRGVPYYYYNLHKILNGVKMEGTEKGRLEVLVTRKPDVYKSFNARLQESYLPVTYFYTRNDSWNEYYGAEEVKIRLEAMLEYTLSLQHSSGAWPEYSRTENSLSATDFGVNYMTQVLRLLREAEKNDPNFPSIDRDLFNRLDAAVRKGIMCVLTSSAMWSHGQNYTNQYGLVWSAALAYLEYHPDDDELRQKLDDRWKDSGKLISPVGFYYEDGGWDMPYNLGVHVQNIAADYHYMRGTKYEKDLIEHQERFFDWLSYNFLVEPDGSFVIVNSAASKRSEASSVVMWRKDFPIAEKIPIARAFVRSQEDIEDEARRNKEATAKNGAWPVLPEMKTSGGNNYNPYGLYNRTLFNYYPTDAERWEAIEMLPYNAKEYFTQQRSDKNFVFSFVKRPSYYAIFNDAPKKVQSSCFGLGAIWSPEGGTFMANYGESQDTTDEQYPRTYDYAWGTKPHQTPLTQEYYRVHENNALDITYTLNGERFTPGGAITDLPEGEIAMSYPLGDKGNKAVTFHDESIDVELTYDGKFLECFPIMLRKEDEVEMFPTMFRVVRGRAVFEIEFDREVKFNLENKNYKQSRLTLHQLTAETYDALGYSIKTYTREPKLREVSSMIQVVMNSSDSFAATEGIGSNNDSATANPQIIPSDIPVSWKELDLENGVSRAQFTAAVVDALGMKGDPEKFRNFTDIPADAWYRESIQAAVQLGLIIGVDETHFAPETVISKEQQLIILERAKAFLLGKLDAVATMNNTVDSGK